MSKKRLTPEDEPYFLVRSLASRMPGGRTIERHAHRWHQLIYASAGIMTVWTERGAWVAPPHWAIWAPAGMQHSIRFTGESFLRTLYFPPEDDAAPIDCAVISVSPLLRELIARTVALGMLDRREPFHAAMATLIRHELRPQNAPPLSLPLPSSDQMKRIADHLSDHPSDTAGSAELAARFGLGVRTLERRFAAETGVPFGRWRRQARLFHALRLLAAGAAVKSAAAESGYRSSSAFVAAFRDTFQTTPARYFGRDSN